MASNQPWTTEALRTLLPLGILLAGAGGFLAIGARRDVPSESDKQSQAPLVQTVAVEPHQSRLVIETDGSVVPYREISLSAEVPGRVEFKAPQFRAGSYVTAGTLLMRVDPASYELERDRLLAEVNQAQASLDELTVEEHSTASLVELAEEQLAIEESELARMQRLFERNVIGESEMNSARRSALSTRNSTTTLRNQLQMVRTRRNRLEWTKKLAEARFDQAKLDLAHTEIKAPVDGVVVSDAVEQDSYVQKGQAVATIEDTSAVEVRCSLRTEELHWIWQQAAGSAVAGPRGPQQDYQIPHVPVTVVYRIGDRRYAWEGRLSRYEGIGLDEKTRTIPCRVLVEEPRRSRPLDEGGSTTAAPPALLRGMFVSVQLHTSPRVPLLKVPQRAVRPGNTVWRVREGQLDVLRLPVAQLLDDGLLVVADESGLSSTDRVVVSPLSAVRSGMPVQEGAAP